MTRHFTPLGNSVNANTIKNDEIALSMNINTMCQNQGVLQRKPKESSLQHLKRVCNYKQKETMTQLQREVIGRACLFLAIREQIENSLHK